MPRVRASKLVDACQKQLDCCCDVEHFVAFSNLSLFNVVNLLLVHQISYNAVERYCTSGTNTVGCVTQKVHPTREEAHLKRPSHITGIGYLKRSEHMCALQLHYTLCGAGSHRSSAAGALHPVRGRP